MPKYQYGEYMDLYWEVGPEALYVYGHVTTEEFWAIVEKYHGSVYSYDAEGPGRYNHVEVKHRYGRFVLNGDYASTGMRMLKTYDVPGRGTFKVTEVNYQDAIRPREACEPAAVPAGLRDGVLAPIEWVAVVPGDR